MTGIAFHFCFTIINDYHSKFAHVIRYSVTPYRTIFLEIIICHTCVFVMFALVLFFMRFEFFDNPSRALPFGRYIDVLPDRLLCPFYRYNVLTCTSGSYILCNHLMTQSSTRLYANMFLAAVKFFYITLSFAAVV